MERERLLEELHRRRVFFVMQAQLPCARNRDRPEAKYYHRQLVTKTPTRLFDITEELNGTKEDTYAEVTNGTQTAKAYFHEDGIEVWVMGVVLYSSWNPQPNQDTFEQQILAMLDRWIQDLITHKPTHFYDLCALSEQQRRDIAPKVLETV